MKNLILLSILAAILQSCSSGSSSGGGTNPVSGSNPVDIENALKDIPDNSILTQTNACKANPVQNDIHGPYFTDTLVKNGVQLDLIRQYFSDNCINSTISISLLKDAVSYKVLNGNEYEFSLALQDVQMTIQDNQLLSIYNTQPDSFYGLTWILNTNTSVIDRKIFPSAPSVSYPKNSISKIALEVFPSAKRVLISGEEFYWQ